ncbi:anhydro-N-acetylmuramic acid kinase [Mycetohabitans sp. B8]|uniref:anhydro-N-acetylmuramic acid kinase n=1 Tax=Mycetohabitans sp. B8 TaxID=2841845 RepID=UPI0034CFEDF4
MQPCAEHNDGHTPSQRAHDADGLYIGLMSGTSMGGVAGVIVDFTQGRPQVRAEAFVSLPPELRDTLFALQSPEDNEVHREAHAANALAARYAAYCHALQTRARVSAGDVRAIGVHGQTIRHRPELGYTRQINNPALLAELTGIDVVADFRSRDVAVGGHAAPLVPAFHAAMFVHEHETRVVCNLGGIASHQVEALAFAWLAMRHVARLPGNLPTVTGVAGERVLGALYPR